MDKIDGCLYKKNKDSIPTLYANVRYNESKKKFFTHFQKIRVRKGEDKMIDPLRVEGERCEAIAVICIESIYLSSSHTTLQVKVDEVAMDFKRVDGQSLLPPAEEYDSDES